MGRFYHFFASSSALNRKYIINPILHTVWLDNHAPTLEKILQFIILVKIPVYKFIKDVVHLYDVEEKPYMLPLNICLTLEACC
jgi:hypothetical protein